MSSYNTTYDTPVRHDDSITRPIFRSRVLRTQKRVCRPIKKKRNTETAGGLKNQMDDNGATVILYSSDSSTDILTGRNPSDSDSTDNEISVMIFERETETVNTPSQNIPLVSSNTILREEKAFLSQTNLTPRELKHPIKAVSSTPNQEILNVSRLRRSVATQTIFTLSGRSSEELSEELKSCITEVSDDKSGIYFNCSPKSNNSILRSPISNLWTSKLNHSESPLNGKTGSRKLSLRSKTMICSAMEKTKDRSDIFTRCKSMEEQRLISNTYSLLPHPKTPPSFTGKVLHNPFEVDLTERIGQTIFSPDVFVNVVSPTEDSESLRWTIEDISSINPVPIDEDFTLPSEDEDPERESQMQLDIDRYFSETHSVLSPYDLSQQFSSSQSKGVNNRVRAVASTPQKLEINLPKEFKNARTQTLLTFLMLPGKLEDSLRSFFTCFDMDDLNLSASNLRRKLFFHSEDEPPSPVRFDSRSAVKGSCSVQRSPCLDVTNKRHFTPLAGQQDFSSPEMSPVVCEPLDDKTKIFSLCKKILHHYYPDNSQPNKEVKSTLFGANSTVIMNSDEGPSEIVNSNSESVPTSQDTGYDSEESWGPTQSELATPMMASTPSRRNE